MLVNGGVGDWDMMSLLRSTTTQGEIRDAVKKRQARALEPMKNEKLAIEFRQKCSEWIQRDGSASSTKG